ncbi:MAG: ATP-binding cassette domain-containing protein [Saprospiraceae bacterium]|nr:ATP-binding cassette domain-containing protein [Saprospiraceae bacterium]
MAGYSSSGKSTLLQIIAGIYSDFKGSLTFNGIPFRNLNPVSLRAHIGDHMSHEDIFKGTLLENITMGHEGSVCKMPSRQWSRSDWPIS